MKKQMCPWMFFVVLLGLLVGVATRAGAQWHDSTGGSFNNSISSGLSSAIWGNMQMQSNLNMQRMMQRSMQQRYQGRATQARRPAQGTTSRAVAGRTSWRAGEHVEVEWRGRWYAAEILEAGNGKYRIHYTGWTSNWDEWVEPARVRSMDDEPGGGDVRRPAVAATTTFTPVSPRLMPQQLAAQMAKTAEQRRQLEQLLAFCLDVFKQYEPQARPASARQAPSHDVARALGYYITINYYVYSQGQHPMPPQPTPQQYEALCATLRAVLLQDAQFQSLDDRHKQQLHETLAIMGSLPILGYQSAEQQKSREQQEAARQLAAQNLGRLGMTPERIQFTDSGMVLK